MLLKSICDRHLAEPLDSPYRMKDVCNHIPENLDGADLETIGYHRGCCQNITENQKCLKCSADSNEASPSRSPHKSASSCAMQMFPWERLNVQQVFSIQGQGGVLKDPTWKQIEPRALELGLHHLHLIVQWENLFAREANVHRSCHMSFNLKYANNSGSSD